MQLCEKGVELTSIPSHAVVRYVRARDEQNTKRHQCAESCITTSQLVFIDLICGSVSKKKCWESLHHSFSVLRAPISARHYVISIGRACLKGTLVTLPFVWHIVPPYRALNHVVSNIETSFKHGGTRGR